MKRAEFDQKKNDSVPLALASWPQPHPRRGFLGRGWHGMQGHYLWGLLPPEGGWDGDTHWPLAWQPGSALKLSSVQRTNRVHLGEDLNGLWWVSLKCSQVAHPSENQTGPAFPGTLLGHILFHLPPSSSIALVCSAGTADHNCRCSLNK